MSLIEGKFLFIIKSYAALKITIYCLEVLSLCHTDKVEFWFSIKKKNSIDFSYDFNVINLYKNKIVLLFNFIYIDGLIK